MVGVAADAGALVAVNAQGDSLVALRIENLPPQTPFGEFDLSLAGLDFTEEEPSAVNQYGVRDVETGSDGSITVHLTENEISGKLIILKRAAYRGVGYAVSDGEGGYVAVLEPTAANLYYDVADAEGWLYSHGTDWASDTQTAETSDRSPLTGLRFMTALEGASVRYSVNRGDGAGWSEYAADGDALSGEKPIEGVKVELEELDFVSFVWYRVYVDGMGWTAWARDGEACGTSGYGAPVLAVQATVQIRDVAAPTAGEPSDLDTAYLLKENGVDDELVDEKTSALESDGGEPKTLAATGMPPEFPWPLRSVFPLPRPPLRQRHLPLDASAELPVRQNGSKLAALRPFPQTPFCVRHGALGARRGFYCVSVFGEYSSGRNRHGARAEKEMRWARSICQMWRSTCFPL